MLDVNITLFQVSKIIVNITGANARMFRRLCLILLLLLLTLLLTRPREANRTNQPSLTTNGVMQVNAPTFVSRQPQQQ